MMAMLVSLVFVAAAGVAAYAIGTTVAPNWAQIGAALRAQPDRFAPLGTLVAAERRIAVRGWATAPRPAARRREAA